jgi:hypothetical protein
MPSGRMLQTALLAQLLDLVTFLVAVVLEPRLVAFELGPIGTVYAVAGPVAATAFKLSGLAVVFAALALYRGRLTRLLLVAVALLGIVAAAANVYALLLAWSLI